jgi:competence protein ComFB
MSDVKEAADPIELRPSRPAGNDGVYGDYILVNAWETMVEEAVGQMQPLMEMCGCPKCFCDACAIVLNNLPPKYVTSHRGEVFSKVSQLNTSSQADLSILAARALQQVKNSPGHD